MKKLFTAIILLTAVLFSTAVPVQVQAGTVGDLTGDTLTDDPVKLINLAILKNVDFENIKVNNHSIIDTLDELQQEDYQYSAAIVTAFTTTVNSLFTGLENNWQLSLLEDYGYDALRLYSTYIGDLNKQMSTAEQVKDAIENYLTQYYQEGVVIGETTEIELGDLFFDYKLVDLTAIQSGVDSFSCTSTKWEFVNNMKFIFNGEIKELTDTKIVTTIGSGTKELKVVYEFDSKHVLKNTKLKVGQSVTQGQLVCEDKDGKFSLTITINKEPLDIFDKLGVNGKILLGEFVSTQFVEFNATRQAYIDYALLK